MKSKIVNQTSQIQKSSIVNRISSIEHRHSNIVNRKLKIVILGAGESGTGTALLAKQQKFEVFVSDFGKIKEKYKQVFGNNGIEWEEEGHSEERILSAD